MSCKPETIIEVTAESATDLTLLECHSKTLMHTPVPAFQMRTILSYEPKNMVNINDSSSFSHYWASYFHNMDFEVPKNWHIFATFLTFKPLKNYLL